LLRRAVLCIQVETASRMLAVVVMKGFVKGRVSMRHHR